MGYFNDMQLYDEEDETFQADAFDFEREQWEREQDPAYFEWLEYIEASASSRQETNDGNSRV